MGEFRLRVARHLHSQASKPAEKFFCLTRGHLRTSLQLGTSVACSGGSNQLVMKKTFLLITTLAGLASTASAASTPNDNAIHVLPTYVVTAPRAVSAEQRVNARLNEFRQEARQLHVVVPGPALPKVQPTVLDHALKAGFAKVVAKS